MLSIGNKKYRNLQEQVGFNTEQIEKIFQILDGLSVTDSVIVISDLSDVLTSEELEIVQKAVAFIVYDGQLYIKKSEDASKAYFDIVFTISASGGVISFTSKEIEVTLSNGALAQTSSSNSTYSSSYLDTAIGAKADTTYVDAQLAFKANLAGANFTGAITAPSIIENMSGYSFVKNTSTENTEIEYIYAGVVKNGNKVTIALGMNLTKIGSAESIRLGDFMLPQSVLDKLFQTQIGAYNYLTYRVENVINASYSAQALSIYSSKILGGVRFTLASTAPLTANSKSYLRFEVTLLLSDNLAS